MRTRAAPFGRAGCGKSTQIPQFILDEALDAGRAAGINIVCTQPRRVAAIGVAERRGFSPRFLGPIPRPNTSAQYLGACQRRTPRTCGNPKAPRDASHRDLPDATLRFGLARRRLPSPAAGGLL